MTAWVRSVRRTVLDPGRCARRSAILVLALLPVHPMVRADQDGLPRIAIVNGPDLSAEADLLSVSLSRAPGMVLLDRSETARILDEQPLALANDDAAIRLAGILGADGLVLLRKVQLGGACFLETEIINATVGIRLWSQRATYPVTDADVWTESACDAVAAMAPKLSVPPENVLCVAIQPFRAVLGTEHATRIAREVSLLLASGLLRHKEVFVLERESMRALQFEKEFAAGATNQFWNAGFVVNGEVAPDGDAPDGLLLRLRVTPPQHAAGPVETFHGARDRTAEVVEQAVRAVVDAIHASGETVAWSLASEADGLRRESGAFRTAGLVEEALTTGEAAYALGARSNDMARLVAELNCEAAIRAYVSRLESRGPEFVKLYFPARMDAMLHISSNSGSTKGFFRVRPRGGEVEIHDLEAALDQTARALDLCESGPENAEGLPQSATLVRVLWTASRLLEVSLCEPFEADRRSREQRIQNGVQRLMDRVTAQDKGMEQPLIAYLAAQDARYWYADPHRVLDLYRRALAADFPEADRCLLSVRHYLARPMSGGNAFGLPDRQPKAPWLINYGGRQASDMDRIWVAFVQGLADSPKIDDRLDGWILKLHALTEKGERAALVRDILADMEQRMPDIVGSRRSYVLAWGLLDDARTRVMSTPEADKIDLFIPVLVEHFLRTGGFCGRPVPYDKRTGASIRDPDHYRVLLRDRVRASEDAESFVEAIESYSRRCGDSGCADWVSWLRGLVQTSAPPAAAQGPAPVDPVRGIAFPNSKLQFVHHIRQTPDTLYALGVAEHREPWQPRIVAYNPNDFSCVSYDPPVALDGLPDWEEIHDVVPAAGFLFYAQSGKLWRCDMASRTWTYVELGQVECPGLCVIGDYLYCGFPRRATTLKRVNASGVIRVHQRTMQVEVLASSLSKMPASPLDGTGLYHVPCIWADAQQRVYVGMEQKRMLSLYSIALDTREWTLVKRRGCIDLFSENPPGKILSVLGLDWEVPAEHDRATDVLKDAHGEWRIKGTQLHYRGLEGKSEVVIPLNLPPPKLRVPMKNQIVAVPGGLVVCQEASGSFWLFPQDSLEARISASRP